MNNRMEKASQKEGLGQLGKLHADPLRESPWGRGGAAGQPPDFRSLVRLQARQDSTSTPAQKSPASSGHSSCHFYSHPLCPTSLLFLFHLDPGAPDFSVHISKVT